MTSGSCLQRINPIDRHIGLRLRQARIRKCLTPTELAAATGISSEHLFLHEIGCRRVGAELMFKMAAVLDVSIGALFADMP